MKMLPPMSLKTAIRAFSLMAVLLFAVHAYPAAAKYPCGDYTDILRTHLQGGYALFMSGSLDNDGALIMMVDTHNGDFIIIGVDNQQRACVLLRGSGLMYFTGEKA